MAVQSVPSLNGVSKQPYASFAGKSESVGIEGMLVNVDTIDNITTMTGWWIVFFLCWQVFR